jgi:hypothetical protein
VQIGAELLCKGGKVNTRNSGEDYRVRSADYGGEESVNAKVQIGLRPVERWKSELKVEDRVRSTEYREANKGDWLA